MATTTKLFQWNYGCLGFSGENSPTILLLIFQWYPEDTPKSLTASFPLKSSIPKYERIVFQAAFLQGDVKLRWCTLKKKVSWKSVPIHNIEWNPAFQPWLTVEKQLSLMDRDKHYPLWQCLGNTFMINDVLIKKIHRWEFLTASFWDSVISKLKPSCGKNIQQISTSYCAFTALRLRGCYMEFLRITWPDKTQSKPTHPPFFFCRLLAEVIFVGARFYVPSVGFRPFFGHWWLLKPWIGQGVGCARAFWGRKYTRMVLGQGRKYTRMVLARVARVTASSVHAVRGLICTREMVLLYVHLCSYSCVFCVLHACRLSGTGL